MKKLLGFLLICFAVMLCLSCALAGGIDLHASGWVELDGGKYYGNQNGQAVTGQWILDDEYYYFDDTGLLQTGWINLEDDSWFTFSEEGHVTSWWFSNIKPGWRYADSDGKILMSLNGMTSLEIPARVDSLPDGFFKGVTREFVVECELDSYAESLAMELGLPYDNGQKRVLGTDITDVDEKVEWIVSNYLSEDMSEREKALRLHNWLIYNAHYDYTFSNYNADGVLIQGAGVCDSYSKAYSLLLTKVGIENKRAIGGNHAWNVIRIDGQWSFVDTTWDDPNDSGEASVSGFERTHYFLMNDATIRRDHTFEEEIWADSNNVGWVTMGAERYYYGTDGKRATGLTEIPAEKYVYNEETQQYEKTLVPVQYFFSSDGVMQTGFQTIGENVYYFGTDGAILKACWIQPDKASGAYYSGIPTPEADAPVYYLNENGVMVTGLAVIDVVKNVYDYENQTWKSETVPSQFYFAEDGAMQTGFQTIGENVYYFGTNGVMLQACWIQPDKTSGAYYSGIPTPEADAPVYYLNENGIMVTGLTVIDITKNVYDYDNQTWKSETVPSQFYFAEDGTMQTGFQTIGENVYYFGTNGVMLQACWIQPDKTSDAYYSGIPIPEADAPVYYLNENGIMVTGLTVIDVVKNVYDYDNQTWKIETIPSQFYFAEDGAMQTGFQTIGENVYYFGTDGVMQQGCWIQPDKEYSSYYMGVPVPAPDAPVYYLNENGVMVTGWKSIGVEKDVYDYDLQTWKTETVTWKVHFAGDGALQTGRQMIDGNTYIFSAYGEMLTGLYTDSNDGSIYYLGEDGIMRTGLTAFWSTEEVYNYTTGSFENVKEENYCLFGDDGKMVQKLSMDQKLILPKAIETIESRAFADLEGYFLIFVPEGVKAIADDAFSGSSVILKTAVGSWAETWAEEHGVPYLSE